MATSKGRDSGSLKERLKQLQEESGMSKSEVCKAVGITVQRYKNYEEGSTPPIDVLKEFMHLYDTDLDYLFGLSDIRYPAKPDPQLEELGLDRSFLYALAKLKELDESQDSKPQITYIEFLKILVHDAASPNSVGCLETQRDLMDFLFSVSSDKKGPPVPDELKTRMPNYLELVTESQGNKLKPQFLELFERTKYKE